MHLTYRNVNDAFRRLVELFAGPRSQSMVVRKNSRNGPVMMIEEPVTITYTHPRERVLFNQARDANPFFHLYESLWMLAGRNDVAPLKYYVDSIDQFSDDGKTFNGAYGRRWRKAANWHKTCDLILGPGEPTMETLDQLQILIQHLKAQPESRRAVLQMWNAEDDLLKIGQQCEACLGKGRQLYNEVGQRGGKTGFKLDYEDDASSCKVCNGKGTISSKDVCCNLSVMFSIRDSGLPSTTRSIKHPELGPLPTSDKYLDMTVTNRSNDMIWGMLGANVVHFSFLQEYMAAHLGCEVGVYNQFTNNLHVYEKGWEPDKWLAYDVADYYCDFNLSQMEDSLKTSMWGKRFTTIPLIKDPAVFDKELPRFVETHGRGQYTEPFLRDVAQWVCGAFAAHKERIYDRALLRCSDIQADDWRIACEQWLLKRKKMWEQKNLHKAQPYSFGVENATDN